MCGHRLHGWTYSRSGCAARMLSAIEHSVINATCGGRWVVTWSSICAVEPATSAAATTSGEHSGCAMTVMPGRSLRSWAMSATEKRSCTSQRAGWVMTSTPVAAATLRARYSSGTQMILSAPRWRTIFSTLPEVQQMSLAAFTAALELT